MNPIPSNSDRCWSVVPAAGNGSRMQAVLPKQYLTLNDKTVIELTLGKLLHIAEISGVVVCHADSDTRFGELAIAKHPRIFTAVGGAERAHSVFNGLCYLRDMAQSDDADWVMVHDAARPCVSHASLERLLGHCRKTGRGAILASPVADTLKRQQANTPIIAETVSRDNLWQAHTPQCFRLGELHAALKAALASGTAITDEASAIECSGGDVDLIEDSRENIKITRPEDLALAGFILGQQALNW